MRKIKEKKNQPSASECTDWSRLSRTSVWNFPFLFPCTLSSNHFFVAVEMNQMNIHDFELLGKIAIPLKALQYISGKWLTK